MSQSDIVDKRVRTTIRLPSELHKRAKAAVLDIGVTEGKKATLEKFIEQAVGELLNRLKTGESVPVVPPSIKPEKNIVVKRGSDSVSIYIPL